MVKISEKPAPATKPAKAPAKKAPTKAATPSAGSRAVLYPERFVEVCDGNQAITVAAAKRLLGWETEKDYRDKVKAERPNAKEADTYFKEGSWLLKDCDGQKVRCYNNAHNRPFNEPWARQLGQDILNRHWADGRNGTKPTKFIYGGNEPYTKRDGTVLNPGDAFEDVEPTLNGETIIVGRYGSVLSGQHRLIGLILAAQIWAGPQASHWAHLWDREPSIEGVIIYGMDESSVTTRTFDNVRPRTLSDVLYTDDLFRGSDKQPVRDKGRQVLCRALDYAIRTMWSRTGMGLERVNAFAPRRTHSESLDFLARHERLKRAVKHVWEEDGKPGDEARDTAGNKLGSGKLTRYLGLGYSSALMYLMGCSDSDGDIYRNGGKGGSDTLPSEKVLDWGRWDKATEFWTLLADDAREFKQVTEAFKQLSDRFGRRPTDQSAAILTRAWNAWIGSGRVTAKDVDIADGYKEDPKTGDTWFEFTTGDYLGGIDYPEEPDSGNASSPPAQPSNGKAGKGKDPSPEELAAEAARIKKENMRQKINEAKARRKAEAEGKGPRTPGEARSIMDVLPDGGEEAATDLDTVDEEVDSNGLPVAVDHGADDSEGEGDEDGPGRAVYRVHDGSGAYYAGNTEDGLQVCDGSEGEAMELMKGDLDADFPGGLPDGWVLERIGTV